MIDLFLGFFRKVQSACITIKVKASDTAKSSTTDVKVLLLFLMILTVKILLFFLLFAVFFSQAVNYMVIYKSPKYSPRARFPY